MFACFVFFHVVCFIFVFFVCLLLFRCCFVFYACYRYSCLSFWLFVLAPFGGAASMLLCFLLFAFAFSFAFFVLFGLLFAFCRLFFVCFYSFGKAIRVMLSC